MIATMAELSGAAAARYGTRTAVTILGGSSISFHDIDAMAGRFAGGLAALGLGRGDRIALHLPNGLDWIIAYHAIARLGGVVVPCNILLTPAEVGWITDDAEVAGQIVASDRCDLIRTAQKGSPRTITERDFARLLASDWINAASCDPDDLFTIGYTSGTTGRPKGANQTHRAVAGSVGMTATIHARHEGDRILTALPFPHVYGNVVLNAGLLAGSALFVLPRFDAGDALAAIARHEITLFEGVPTMFYQMLTHPDVEVADLRTLRRCTVGGQTMPLAKIEEVVTRFGCPLLELWGMTEVAGPAITHSPYWPARHGSIGLPFPGMEVRIGSLQQAGGIAKPLEAGEILVRGPLVTKSYWRNPRATAEAIDAEGWLATGDVGYADPDGYIFVVDRLKDMIITGGYNIYPAEVEQVLATHPAVAMSAVVGVPDAEKGELAHAYIVLAAGCEPDEAVLNTHCRAILAPYKVPRRYHFVNELPRTSTGKILRRALRDPS
ncbi:AMP-dependent synthetase [Sphingobium amiense]|uniref:3-methylmercaptopropionyl-CoA ligase n=1 Tax=Sphingobium amiense TaxID=135719 RepID=A0A494W8I6_9SPHN|nr:AMP-binding protein [Sphingobium amiense]BBD99636.1 AMP-dependent synthetase [Sphingobium amiense]